MPRWSLFEASFADPRVWHFGFHRTRDLPEHLLFGREYEYVSGFIVDRTSTVGRMRSRARRCSPEPSKTGNTRGGLAWPRAFLTDHAHGLVWKRAPLRSGPRLGRRAQIRPENRRDSPTDVSGDGIADPCPMAARATSGRDGGYGPGAPNRMKRQNRYLRGSCRTIFQKKKGYTPWRSSF
jgi:hypothetical protein